MTLEEKEKMFKEAVESWRNTLEELAAQANDVYDAFFPEDKESHAHLPEMYWKNQYRELATEYFQLKKETGV